MTQKYRIDEIKRGYETGEYSHPTRDNSGLRLDEPSEREIMLVAKALCRAEGLDPDETWTEFTRYVCPLTGEAEEVQCVRWEYHAHRARAAIEAIRLLEGE